MRLAGAGDRVAAQRAGIERQADLGESPLDRSATSADVREHEVLLARDPDLVPELGESRSAGRR